MSRAVDLKRRRVVAVASAGAAALAGRAAYGQAPAAQPGAAAQPAVVSPPRAKTLVWLDMDQAELDAAYDQSKYAPNIQQVLKRYALNSESARARLGPPRRVPYGPTPVEALDIYVTDRPRAPIHIFIHGGAWRTGLAKDYAFAAELFVRAGAHLVVPDFINVVDAGGNLMPMADQVRRAVAWVYRNASSFGGDPARVYLSGHSSGAHLSAVALTTDWQKEFDLPSDIVKGALCCSGPYDLKAPRLSARSNYIKFTDEIEQALSPPRHIDRIVAPIVLVYGSLETPEFQRQSRDFAAALKAAGKPVQLIVADEYNHFEVIETMAHPYGIVARAVLGQMKLG
jgi:arylformamidase